MAFEEKCWGKVWHIFSFADAAVSHLQVNAGFRCSMHSHKERVNMFAVISGKLLIEEWGGAGKYQATELGPGETYTVPVDVVHRFEVLESGEVIEVYWPAHEDDIVRLNDIERIDHGGRVGG